MKSSDKNPEVQSRIKKNATLFGNKAANLIELDALCQEIKSESIRIQIPDIFPINNETIMTHLDTYAKKWRELWSDFSKAQADSKTLTMPSKKILEELQTLITKTFENHPFSPEVKLPPDTLLMVRSTGDEDKVDIANPGGNKSVVAVKLDPKSISNAINVVVTSYLSEKSLTQRLLSGDNITKEPFMPVLIQKMIGEKLNGEEKTDNIVISGVMYAKNSMTRIEAAPGHGELIVNSKSECDIYDVTQNNMVHAEIYHKDTRLIPVEIKNHESKERPRRKLQFKENPKQLQHEPALPSAIAVEIARVGHKIYAHYQMPMDIEFVYHPKEKILYIVQARPIPEIHHKIQPFAISPEHWTHIKRNPQIKKIPLSVVSPGGNAAKIITAKDQVIISDTINQALNQYIKHPDIQRKIRAVIVKQPALSTSHEAAQFNSLGIPVLQADDVELVKAELSEKKPVFIIDPQHHHLINWTKEIKDQKNAEKELRDTKIIKDGLFASSLNSKKTLLPVGPIENKVIEQTIKQYLNQKPLEIKNIYQELLQCFDTLEGVKCNDENKAAFAALNKMAGIFAAIGTSTRAKEKGTSHQRLFQHAMISIAEIDHCLHQFSLDKQNDFQKHLLDLISKLKALVINPGETKLYSDSILQMAMQNKALNKISLADEKLTPEQRDYLVEFVKLNEQALNVHTKEKWIEFALTCSKKPFTRQLLAKIIKISHEHHLLSELVNISFIKHWNAAIEHTEQGREKILADLFAEFTDNEREFKSLHLKENNQIIAGFEKRINDWSYPEKFIPLFNQLQEEMVPLLNRLELNDNMSNLTKKAVLRQVQYLTEVIDKSIKSLKGSPEYSTKTNLLIERFVKFLKPYHQLMEKWMNQIPEDLYKKWAIKVTHNFTANTKNPMITSIRETFTKISDKRDAAQLHPSEYFSVASAKVGAPASFERQFVIRKELLTLEDLFSLFHQNILASTGILSKDLEIKAEQLPEPIQLLVTTLKQNSQIDMLDIHHQYPIVKIEYNIPLRNHSAKLILEYNTKTQLTTLHGQFFGVNRNDRLGVIARTAKLEGELLKANVFSEPFYNDLNFSQEFNWEFKLDQIHYLSKHINNIIKSYSKLTDNTSEKLANQAVLNRHSKAIELDKVFKSLSNKKQPNIKLSDSKSLILSAAQEGHLDLVKILIENQPALLEHTNQFNQTPLLWAAANGHDDIVKYLISKKANLNIATNHPGTTDHDKTPLYWAAERGHNKIVAMLVNACANATTALDGYLYQPIHIAAQKGLLDVVKALIENNPELLDQPDRLFETPLIWAAYSEHADVVEYLISKGANLNAITESKDDENRGKTPLYWAAQHGNNKIVAMLTKAGGIPTALLDQFKARIESNPKLLDQPIGKGETPLIWAAVNGYDGIVEYLIRKHVPLNVTTKEGKTPFYLAVEGGHGRIAAMLIKAGADTNAPVGDRLYRPIHIAAKKGLLGIVKALIENNPKLLDQPDLLHETPLIWAAFCNHADVVKYLINKGANLNATTKSADEDGDKTALYWVAERGYSHIAAMLVNAGANVTTALGKNRDQPVHIAAKKGLLDVMKVLIENKPELLEATDNNGQTPLLWAAANNHADVVEYLISKGANLNVTTKSNDDDRGKTPLYWAAERGYSHIVAMLARAGANTTAIGDGYRPIDIAAKKGFLDVVNVLIENDPKLLPDQLDRTLFLAGYYEHVDLFVMLMTAGANITTALDEHEKAFYHKLIIKAAENGQLDRVKKLTENNPKLLDQPDQKGETPLIWAAYGGHADIVEYLISKGAKLNAITSEGAYKGRTSLHWAAEGGHNEVVEILLKHGAAVTKRINKSELNSKVKAKLELVEFIQKTPTTNSMFHFFGYSNKQKLDAANALKTVIFNDAKESSLDAHKEILVKSRLNSIYRNLK